MFLLRETRETSFVNNGGIFILEDSYLRYKQRIGNVVVRSVIRAENSKNASSTRCIAITVASETVATRLINRTVKPNL